MPQTTTAVHDESSRRAAADRTQKRENNLALCTLLYAQLLISSALSLLSIASTASYLSLLIALIPAAALYFLSARCHKKHAAPPRPLSFCFALLFFSDMALCLLALTELVCAYVLPHYARLLIALSSSAGTGLMLLGRQPGGARRTAAFLCPFFLAALLICLLIALPQADIGHIFPLLGYGAEQTLRGALHLTGSLWSVGALPFFTHAPAAPGFKKQRPYAAPLLTVLLMCGLLFFYACLLPAPLLPGRWGFVLQLQLIMEMSPSILSWSLMLISRMLLFLTGFAVSGDMLCECLRPALPGRRLPVPVLLLLPALTVLLPTSALTQTLPPLLPLRYALCFIFVVLSLFMRKKEVSA